MGAYVITVVSLNSAMDRTLLLPQLVPGQIHRALRVEVRAGGKGLNVARAIRRLGEPVRVLGFSGGVLGQFLQAECQRLGLEAWWTPIGAELRVCSILVPGDGSAPTVINEPGPTIQAPELDHFLTRFEHALSDTELLVLSGSLPRGVPDETYARLIRRAASMKIKSILDSSGKALQAGVSAGPWAITPNLDEFREIVPQPWQTAAEFRECCFGLTAQGGEVVVVTLGAAGSLVYSNGEIWRVIPPRIQAVNPIGSGDAFVAGLAVSVYRNEPLLAGMKLATACAAANAASFEPEIPEPTELSGLLNQVVISRWE